MILNVEIVKMLLNMAVFTDEIFCGYKKPFFFFLTEQNVNITSVV